jgi:7-alpha-hydroxysteroid dehydrogenase
MTQAVQSAPPGEGADEFRLDGYVALVTGAGRGIGAGIAQTYARAGADLVLVARTAADLGHIAASVRAMGRTALVIPADLTDVSQAVKIIERAIAERGRLDILVNNAGGAMPAAYLDTTPETLDEAFHFNVAARLNSPNGPPRTCSTAAAARWSTSPREWTASPPGEW